MNRLRISWLALVVLTHVFLPQIPCRGNSLVEEARERIRTRIEEAGPLASFKIADDIVLAWSSLPRFYEMRGYYPVWIGDDGHLAIADSLLASIRFAGSEGLNPADYHLEAIEKILESISKQNKRSSKHAELVDLELLLTDAYLVYGTHLLKGKVNPKTIDPEWHAKPREKDIVEILTGAVESGKIRASLDELLPNHKGYSHLKAALASCQNKDKSEEPPTVHDGPALKPGDRNERVSLLRARLMAADSLLQSGTDDEQFDSLLEESVRRFQVAHGLEPDGVVGPMTLNLINTTAEEKALKIRANLERWRWLPEDLGYRYIIVNIANFELDMFEGNTQLLTMRAVVGKPYRRTPVFSDKITYLVFNPYWHVPPKIAKSDILPKIKKEPNFARENGYRLFTGWTSDAQEIDPASIDWAEMTPAKFNFRLRQDPGPKNLLGRVKFMFPNEFNVYLHDTPARELFAKSSRDFSSGCIRIEKPLELAELLLANDPEWSAERIRTTADGSSEQTVMLKAPIAVHLLYWTAWASENSVVHFRRDIYDRDKALIEALLDKPPGS